MTRLMGIDYGQKRIGLAVCDPSGLVARELAIIHRAGNPQDFGQINRHAQEQQVTAFVVGLPVNDWPEAGGHDQAKAVRDWVEALKQTTPLPIIFWDEQLTSVEAREISIRQRRKVRDPIDDLAARVMLQSYLDAVRDGLAEPPPNLTP
ncbi:MAG TPA: Holliday junction resolvase RuvX [Phototrophicaceae bacterium]|nr:Holliday junction resolvase RuvX [Phototrophicaceae bacterium]